MVIEFPQVGHCPSCAAMASVASRREEQYPQLKPYRFPPPEGRNPDIAGGRIGGGGGGKDGGESAMPASAAACTATGDGTCSLVRQLGHNTQAPACACSADSFLRHTAQSNTIIGWEV